VKLERSITELHQVCLLPPRLLPSRSAVMLTPPCAPQLFMDMAVLVESQGELLNQIEHNVEQAVGYVAQGVDELNKVLMWHSKRAEMQCC
jgi:hypothetical protein